jgi:ornithine decarboxylase
MNRSTLSAQTERRPSGRAYRDLHVSRETSVPALHLPDLSPTPYLALDVDVAESRLRALQSALAGTAMHYAVKANPHPALLRRLVSAGGSFDVASPHEVRLCVDAGAHAADLLYSNPVKGRGHLAEAYALGVRTFVVDSLAEVNKVADLAPRSTVVARLLTSGAGSDWPLSRKYGLPEQDCAEVLAAAAELGLEPAGVSFHVGSQQRDVNAWDGPIRQSARVFRELRRQGLSPWLLDLGGGFPADLMDDAPALDVYGRAIEASLERHFGSQRPRTVAEPGRGIVGDAGTLVASVIGVCWRGGRRWVYLDAGVFTGLVETLDEAIRYRIETPGRAGPVGPCVLAGPSCDSADVMYERTPVELSQELAEGDLVLIRSTGAYTSSYSTVGFNGFAPLPTTLVRGLP